MRKHSAGEDSTTGNRFRAFCGRQFAARLDGTRRLRQAAVALALAALCLAHAAPARAEALDPEPLVGVYIGLDDAEGWRIEITGEPASAETLETAPIVDDPDAAFVAAIFRDRVGRPTPFAARLLQDDNGLGAEGRITLAGRDVFLRLAQHPAGLFVVWVPLLPSGDVDTNGARSYGFVRSDLAPSTRPSGVTPEPNSPLDAVDMLQFVDSYEFWTPAGVGAGFAGLPQRHQQLIKLFAHVHLDILWKLCQAATPPAGIDVALDGQDASCRQILLGVREMQRSGTFNAYKEELARQKGYLLDAVLCSRGVKFQDECVEIGRVTSAAAVSLETPRTVMERYL